MVLIFRIHERPRIHQDHREPVGSLAEGRTEVARRQSVFGFRRDNANQVRNHFIGRSGWFLLFDADICWRRAMRAIRSLVSLSTLKVTGDGERVAWRPGFRHPDRQGQKASTKATANRLALSRSAVSALPAFRRREVWRYGRRTKGTVEKLKHRYSMWQTRSWLVA